MSNETLLCDNYCSCTEGCAVQRCILHLRAVMTLGAGAVVAVMVLLQSVRGDLHDFVVLVWASECRLFKKNDLDICGKLVVVLGV